MGSKTKRQRNAYSNHNCNDSTVMTGSSGSNRTVFEDRRRCPSPTGGLMASDYSEKAVKTYKIVLCDRPSGEDIEAHRQELSEAKCKRLSQDCDVSR